MSSTCPGCLPQPGGRGDEHGHPRAPTADGEVGREKGNGGGCSPPPPPSPPDNNHLGVVFTRLPGGKGRGRGRLPPPAASAARSGRTSPAPGRFSALCRGSGSYKFSRPRLGCRRGGEAAAGSSRGRPGDGGAGSPPGAERSGAPCRVRSAAPRVSVPPFRSAAPARMQTPGGGEGMPPAPPPAPRSRSAPGPLPAQRQSGPKGSPPRPPERTPGMRTAPGGGGGQGGAEQRRSVPDPLRH